MPETDARTAGARSSSDGMMGSMRGMRGRDDGTRRPGLDGVLGKLFGQVLEDVDPGPLEALQSTGASRLRILLYGVLPQAAPQFVSYAPTAGR